MPCSKDHQKRIRGILEILKTFSWLKTRKKPWFRRVRINIFEEVVSLKISRIMAK